MTNKRRGLSLAEVLRQHHPVHAQLIAYIDSVIEDLFRSYTRFRRRLRSDPYRLRSMKSPYLVQE